MIDQAKSLRDLIRQQTERPATPACAKPAILAVTGGKGGVGTTTIAIHLARALARQSDRVLLVDADPDRADLAAMCELAVHGNAIDPPETWTQLEEHLVPGPEGVAVLPGPCPNSTAERTADRFHSRWIRAVRQAEEPPDWVVVDTGNGSSPSVRVLWRAADLVLLVTTPELPSILDAYASIKTLADRDAPPAIHTLVNRAAAPAVAYDVHGRIARAVWRFLGLHLASAGHLAAWREGQDVSTAAREFGELARTLRAACTSFERLSNVGDPLSQRAAESPAP